MKEIYYTYNNEALASCVFLMYLQYVKRIDIGRSCIILPLLLDDRTVEYLMNINYRDYETLESIIKNKPILFTSFNKRYLTLLPITINSLVLLKKNQQIQILSNEICTRIDFTYGEIDMGNRFEKIKKVIPLVVDIFNKYSTTKLYKLLNIQL